IGGVPRKQLVSFTRQLSTLQDAGLPILRSLQILEQQQRPGLLKAIIGGVSDEVEGGGTLSDAMSKFPKAFDKLYVNMINAGVAILDAVNITKETCGNEVYAKALSKVHDAIREGESMADPLRATKICDAIVVNMIDVGEETGDLDKMLMKIADNYDNDVDVLVSSLISILEPVMVVILGVIVGFIVIALFAPMISLIQTVSSPSKKK